MLLAKGKKSLQLSLNETIPKLKHLTRPTVSKVAYSKARRKLKHGAFIELNQKTVVDVMYGDDDYKTWYGYRILATDGSRVILPDTDDIIAQFGTVAYDNKQGYSSSSGKHATARASVLYDVLNRIVLDATLAPIASYEGDLAIAHLKKTAANDLVIYDRGYAAYRIMAAASAKINFLIRCPKGRFPVATAMLAGQGADDQIVELKASPGFAKDPQNHGLPITLKVRFVRVHLDNGEIEVLVTSLLDQQLFTPADFKELYYLRWGVETFYGLMKTRLGLENFSGYSVEAVQQDFHAMIFLTGSETLLTMDAEDHLGKQTGGHQKKVNKAVSFSKIKEQAFELYYSKLPQAQKLEELTQLFMTSPTLIRKHRNPPRRHPSSHRILGFWKRNRKEVF